MTTPGIFADNITVLGKSILNDVSLSHLDVSQNISSGNLTVLGNVGIGTTAPSHVLHISGQQPYIRIHNSNNTRGFLLGSDNDGSIALWGNNNVGDTGWNRVMTIDISNNFGTIDINNNFGIRTVPFSQYNDPTLDVGGSTYSTRYRGKSSLINTTINILSIPNVSRLYGLNVNFVFYRGALIYSGRMYGVFRKILNLSAEASTHWNMIGQDITGEISELSRGVSATFTNIANGESTYALTFNNPVAAIQNSEIIINLTMYYCDL